VHQGESNEYYRTTAMIWRTNKKYH